MGNINDVYEGHDFNCSEVDPAKVYEALPVAWYTAIIKEAEVKSTKSNTGFYLKVQFCILTPPQFQDRKVFTNINLRNPNSQAEEIGMRELSALGHAAGVMNIGDSADLLNKVVQIKLSVVTSDKYGVQNEVKGYKSPDGTDPAVQPGAAAAPTATPAAPAASVPPWKRK